MFKMLHPLLFVVPVAWLTLLVVLGLDVLSPFLEVLGVTPRVTWSVFIVQLIVTAVFVTPTWRLFWWAIPPLNRWIYPDLNGEWDVELNTNWPRVDALLKAAKGEVPAIDMRLCDETLLPPLGKMVMRARIKQSWVTMKMDLWNPAETSPIKESQTVLVEPFRGEDGRHGLAYIFEQENATDVVSDDSKFRGAAWIVRDRDDPNVLCGRMWSDRMWRRGMNTAADLRFTRAPAGQRGRRRRGTRR